MISESIGKVLNDQFESMGYMLRDVFSKTSNNDKDNTDRNSTNIASQTTEIFNAMEKM